MNWPELRRLITGYCAALRESHTFAGESQTQSDRLLAWTVALMGAGIFAAPTFLSSVGADLHGSRGGLLVLAPWVLGILFGVVGRLFALELRDANNLYVAERLHAIEMLSFDEWPDVDTVRKQFIGLMTDSGDHLKRNERVECFQRWTRVCYYSAYLMLGLGTIAVVAFAAFGERAGMSV